MKETLEKLANLHVELYNKYPLDTVQHQFTLLKLLEDVYELGKQQGIYEGFQQALAVEYQRELADERQQAQRT